MLRIEARGLISDASKRPESEHAQAFVGLRKLSSGSILCTCQAGPAKNSPTSTLVIFRSRDEGRSWEENPFRFKRTLDGKPGSYSSGEIVEIAPGRLLLYATWFDRSDPGRPLFDPVTRGLLPSRNLVSESTDDGETWGSWRELDTQGLTGCSSTGPILRWPDGTIALPFESYRSYDDPRPERHAARMFVSRDNGRTFAPSFLVAQDPERKIYYWDQRVCPGSTPHEFVALFWTHDLVEQRDLTVHLMKGSLANGTGAPAAVVPTPIPGQIAAPLLLDGGKLLAFVVDRGSTGTMTLWMSRDGGSTWGESLVVHAQEEQAAISQGKDNIVFEDYWVDMRNWSFGHPAVISLGGHQVLLAFYAGAPNAMSIHWVRVAVD